MNHVECARGIRSGGARDGGGAIVRGERNRERPLRPHARRSGEIAPAEGGASARHVACTEDGATAPLSHADECSNPQSSLYPPPTGEKHPCPLPLPAAPRRAPLLSRRAAPSRRSIVRRRRTPRPCR